MGIQEIMRDARATKKSDEEILKELTKKIEFNAERLATMANLLKRSVGQGKIPLHTWHGLHRLHDDLDSLFYRIDGYCNTLQEANRRGRQERKKQRKRE